MHGGTHRNYLQAAHSAVCSSRAWRIEPALGRVAGRRPPGPDGPGRPGPGGKTGDKPRRGRMAGAVRPGPERRGQSLAGTGIPALGRTHQITESEYISTNRSRKKANIMAAQATTPRFTAAGLLRAWIIAGLGALILLMVFMLHTTPASASQAGPATPPCATSARS